MKRARKTDSYFALTDADSGGLLLIKLSMCIRRQDGVVCACVILFNTGSLSSNNREALQLLIEEKKKSPKGTGNRLQAAAGGVPLTVRVRTRAGKFPSADN